MDTSAGRGRVAALAVAVLAAACTGGGSNDDATPTSVSAPLEIAVEQDCDDARLAFLVWIEPDAAAEEVDALQRRLDGLLDSPEAPITSYRYVDQAETFAEFTEQFADTPEMLAVVTEGMVPPSFRVVGTDSGAVAEAAVGFEGLPGVRDVDGPGGYIVCT